MTYYRDLSDETMVDAGPHIRAVGWLDDQHKFPIGKTSAKFVNKLRKFTGKCYESIGALGWCVYAGFHRCEHCHEFTSTSYIGVPANDLLYVAPEMISHYVEQHEYVPPEEFIKAVLEAPLPGTKKYEVAVAPFRKLHKEYIDRSMQEM